MTSDAALPIACQVRCIGEPQVDGGPYARSSRVGFGGVYNPQSDNRGRPSLACQFGGRSAALAGAAVSEAEPPGSLSFSPRGLTLALAYPSDFRLWTRRLSPSLKVWGSSSPPPGCRSLWRRRLPLDSDQCAPHQEAGDNLASQGAPYCRGMIGGQKGVPGADSPSHEMRRRSA